MSEGVGRQDDSRLAALTVFDHMVAAGERHLLGQSVPLDMLSRVMMQHAASVVSLVEPPAVRAEIMRRLISNFPAMVRTAQLAKSTTAGGVIVPNGVSTDALAEPA